MLHSVKNYESVPHGLNVVQRRLQRSKTNAGVLFLRPALSANNQNRSSKKYIGSIFFYEKENNITEYKAQTRKTIQKFELPTYKRFFSAGTLPASSYTTANITRLRSFWNTSVMLGIYGVFVEQRVTETDTKGPIITMATMKSEVEIRSASSELDGEAVRTASIHVSLKPCIYLTQPNRNINDFGARRVDVAYPACLSNIYIAKKINELDGAHTWR
ncbi:hypothetical protein CBL_09331 [Carabus blaptoides fortunei]